MKAILGYIISFGALILSFALINLFVVGGQKLWHHGDQVKLDTLKAEINVSRRDITQREADLSALDSEAKQSAMEIADLKARIHATEQEYPSGIPQSIYDSYSQLISECNSDVDKYNATLVRYNALHEDYSERIKECNALIDQSNELSKQIGGTWYIIPVPVPRFTHESTAVKPHSE